MTYTVIENTPGYLPENDDPFLTESLEDAKASLREDVERYVEDDDRFVASYADDGMSAYVRDISKMYDLGRVFEIVESND